MEIITLESKTRLLCKILQHIPPELIRLTLSFWHDDVLRRKIEAFNKIDRRRKCGSCSSYNEVLLISCGCCICRACLYWRVSQRYLHRHTGHGLPLNACPVSVDCYKALTHNDFTLVFPQQDVFTMLTNAPNVHMGGQYQSLMARMSSICRRVSVYNKKLDKMDGSLNMKMDRMLDKLSKLKIVCLQSLGTISDAFPTLVFACPESLTDANNAPSADTWKRVKNVLGHPFLAKLRLHYLCEGHYLDNAPHLTGDPGMLITVPREYFLKLLPVLKAILVLVGVICSLASSGVIQLGGAGAFLNMIDGKIKKLAPKKTHDNIFVKDIEEKDSFEALGSVIGSAAEGIAQVVKHIKGVRGVPTEFDEDSMISASKSLRTYLLGNGHLDDDTAVKGICGLVPRYCDKREKIVFVCPRHVDNTSKLH